VGYLQSCVLPCFFPFTCHHINHTFISFFLDLLCPPAYLPISFSILPKPMKNSKNNFMEVVCAVIKRERSSSSGRNIVEYLIGMCIYDDNLSGRWEFIGGKVEERESHSDAIKRVVMEKVGAEIEITGLQHPIEHSYNHTNIRRWPYECKLTENSPDPRDLVHLELAWIESWDMW
jgi:hypothetical protein